METWLAKKEVLTKKQGYIAKVETQLSQTEGLLFMANKKVKAAEEQAISAIAWTIKEYGKIESFERYITKAGVDA